MNSIYIEGIELPKDKVIAIVVHPDGTAYASEMCAGVCTKQLSDCKATPVPQHGRLGDLDALRKDWLENYKWALTPTILATLDNAPAVIPTSEEKK